MNPTLIAVVFLIVILVGGTITFFQGNMAQVNAQEIEGNSTAAAVNGNGTISNGTLTETMQEGNPAAISIDKTATSADSEIKVSGTGFIPGSNVDIYLVSAIEKETGAGTTSLFFEPSSSTTTMPSSNSTSISEQANEQGKNIFDLAIDKLKELLPSENGGSQQQGDRPDNQIAAVGAGNNGSLYFSIDSEGIRNGTVSLECDEQPIGTAAAQASSSGTLSGWLRVLQGEHDNCSINVDSEKDDNVISDQVGDLSIVGGPQQSFSDSAKIGSATSDGTGSFTQSIEMPDDAGQADTMHAIFAISDSNVAFENIEIENNSQDTGIGSAGINASQTASEASNQATDQETDNNNENITGEIFTNATSGIGDNETESQTITEENNTNTEDNNNEIDNITTSQNITSSSINETQAAPADNATTPGSASIQVNSEKVSQGSTLAVTGEGFKPNSNLQVFIDKVQITNVITNIEGSFNTVIIVPTVVNTGNAQVIVKNQQTTITENVDVVQKPESNAGIGELVLAAVSAQDNGASLKDAPVTVFDASTGDLVLSGNTPVKTELKEGMYSVFYSNFDKFNFVSASPGKWKDTKDGGTGTIKVDQDSTVTVTALYNEEQRRQQPQQQQSTDNSLRLKAIDTKGNPVSGMFVTVYNPSTGNKIAQGFTELVVDGLSPGTYPIFYANYGDMTFQTANPGTWVQTPYGGTGLVTIKGNDNGNQEITVTAVYQKTENPVNVIDIDTPANIKGTIFTITSNETRPEGPFIISGTFSLKINDENDPESSRFSAALISVRDSANENVQLDSQRTRDHDTLHITDFKGTAIRAVGPHKFIIAGTADLLLDGSIYSNNEQIRVLVWGGSEKHPSNIEVDFIGNEKYSAENRVETLYGTIE